MKYLILLTGVICGSLSVIFSRFAVVPAMVLVVYRMAIASLLLVPQMIRHRQEYSRLPGKLLALAAAGGIALGLHFAMFFQAARTTSLAAASVLCNTQVLFVALFSMVLFRTRYSWRAVLAMAGALAGACLISLGGSSGGTDSLSGDLFAVGSAVTLAVYTMISARCRRQMETVLYTTITYPCAAAIALVISLFSGMDLLGGTVRDLAAGLGLAVFCTFLGHSLFSFSLRSLSPSLVSTIQLLDSVFCVLWGVLLFHETPSPLVLLGGLLATGCVIAFCLIDREPASES